MNNIVLSTSTYRINRYVSKQRNNNIPVPFNDFAIIDGDIPSYLCPWVYTLLICQGQCQISGKRYILILKLLVVSEAKSVSASLSQP